MWLQVGSARRFRERERRARILTDSLHRLAGFVPAVHDFGAHGGRTDTLTRPRLSGSPRSRRRIPQSFHSPLVRRHRACPRDRRPVSDRDPGASMARTSQAMTTVGGDSIVDTRRACMQARTGRRWTKPRRHGFWRHAPNGPHDLAVDLFGGFLDRDRQRLGAGPAMLGDVEQQVLRPVELFLEIAGLLPAMTLVDVMLGAEAFEFL